MYVNNLPPRTAPLQLLFSPSLSSLPLVRTLSTIPTLAPLFQPHRHGFIHDQVDLRRARAQRLRCRPPRARRFAGTASTSREFGSRAQGVSRRSHQRQCAWAGFIGAGARKLTVRCRLGRRERATRTLSSWLPSSRPSSLITFPSTLSTTLPVGPRLRVKPSCSAKTDLGFTQWRLLASVPMSSTRRYATSFTYHMPIEANRPRAGQARRHQRFAQRLARGPEQRVAFQHSQRPLP